jgi:antibiotic biosynthesis monooxygenase (ABM) superfamily enzyme
MASLIIEYRLPTEAVASYSEWKEVFDSDPVDRPGHGATSHRILQVADDANHFLLSLEFPTVEQARGFLNEPMLKGSWDAAGAGRSWVVIEVEGLVY